MSRLLGADEHQVSAVDEGLLAAHDGKALAVAGVRFAKFIARHREARQIQIANAQGRVEVARIEMRALEAELKEIEHQDAECVRTEEEIMALFDSKRREFTELAHIIAMDGRALGIKHMRADLLPECSPAEQATV